MVRDKLVVRFDSKAKADAAAAALKAAGFSASEITLNRDDDNPPVQLVGETNLWRKLFGRELSISEYDMVAAAPSDDFTLTLYTEEVLAPKAVAVLSQFTNVAETSDDTSTWDLVGEGASAGEAPDTEVTVGFGSEPFDPDAYIPNSLHRLLVLDDIPPIVKLHSNILHPDIKLRYALIVILFASPDSREIGQILRSYRPRQTNSENWDIFMAGYHQAPQRLNRPLSPPHVQIPRQDISALYSKEYETKIAGELHDRAGGKWRRRTEESEIVLIETILGSGVEPYINWQMIKSYPAKSFSPSEPDKTLNQFSVLFNKVHSTANKNPKSGFLHQLFEKELIG